MSGRTGLRVLAVLVLAVGLCLIGEEAVLRAKAALAEVLISRAFATHLQDGRPHHPWDWADMHPVARLDVDRLAVRRFVLSGASGSSMAFGVGHLDGTALPNQPGNCALAGHRDSWFEFLRAIEVGDELTLQTRAVTRRYVVREIQIVSMWDTWVLEPTSESRLTLVTCYPFGGLLRSPQRYVVVCEPVLEAEGARQAPLSDPRQDHRSTVARESIAPHSPSVT